MDTSTEDPLGVLEASEAAIAAMARTTLRRAGIYYPTPEQIDAAREGAKIIYAAQAADLLRTGTVRP